MKTKDLDREEQSLLLFLETRAVDYGGRVNGVHMNEGDFKIVERWNKEGFIGFGRIVARHANNDGCHWVKLTDESLKLAHELRIERMKRMWKNKSYITTEDNIEMHGHPHLSGLNGG